MRKTSSEMRRPTSHGNTCIWSKNGLLPNLYNHIFFTIPLQVLFGVVFGRNVIQYFVQNNHTEFS
jgi:hypothetical protein